MMNILLNGTGGLLVATINDNGCGRINWTPKNGWFWEET
jgi:hypothetical protein